MSGHTPEEWGVWPEINTFNVDGKMITGNTTGVHIAHDLLKALESIANLGGNLPDEQLTTKTGANVAVMRGLMYTEARRIARGAIAKAESRS